MVTGTQDSKSPFVEVLSDIAVYSGLLNNNDKPEQDGDMSSKPLPEQDKDEQHDYEFEDWDGEF